MLERIHAFIAKLGRRSDPWRPSTITLDETGFRILPPDKAADAISFSWQEITAVTVFKRDLFTVDQICLAFSARNKQIEINEDDIGWIAFAQSIETHLPGSMPFNTWWSSVGLTAFATNTTVIYSKE